MAQAVSPECETMERSFSREVLVSALHVYSTDWASIGPKSKLVVWFVDEGGV